MIASCQSVYYVPLCDRWPKAAVDEMIDYMEAHPNSAMIVSILKDAQTCKALKELQ